MSNNNTEGVIELIQFSGPLPEENLINFEEMKQTFLCPYCSKPNIIDLKTVIKSPLYFDKSGYIKSKDNYEMDFINTCDCGCNYRIRYTSVHIITLDDMSVYDNMGFDGSTIMYDSSTDFEISMDVHVEQCKDIPLKI